MKKKVIIGAILIIIVIMISIIISIKPNGAEKKKDKVIEEKRMSLVMVGDVLIHEAVYKDALNSDGTYSFDKMFKQIKPILKDYDLKYCNQESIIGGSDLEISGYPAFNSPDEIGDTITKLGFNLIGLANNHAFDKGEKAVIYSNNYWNKKNVITSGSYLSQEQRDNIEVYEQNGIKYAFLAYTTGINGNNLPSDKEYLINIYDKEKVKNDINKIKNKVDFIMVAMHWGDEYTNTPTNIQKEIANYLSGLGVNLIIGTHPHVVQPIEYIDDTLVIYSLGNFISNQLVIGENPAIGLLLGIEIKLDKKITMQINKKELIYSYSDNSTNFQVIPFSKMNDKVLPNYKKIEEKYLNIIGNIK